MELWPSAGVRAWVTDVAGGQGVGGGEGGV